MFNINRDFTKSSRFKISVAHKIVGSESGVVFKTPKKLGTPKKIQVEVVKKT